MICVVKTRHGWGEFDWAGGVRCFSAAGELRNMDEIALAQRQKVEDLRERRTEVLKRFEELCEEDAILNAAIREAQEALDDLMEVARPFKVS